MNKAFRVSLIAIIAALILAALLTPLFGGGAVDYEAFMVVLGLILLAGGAGLAFAALIVYVSGNKDWGKPLLLACAVCFVIGTGVCGSLFLRM